jgi:hypothetical protein
MKHLSLATLLLVFVGTMSMAQSNPQPLVYPSLVPVSTAPGGSAFSLTVGGYGFVPGAVVQWNGSPRATTFVSSSSLQAAISATDIASAGTALVTVLNPAPGGGSSNPVYFPVAQPEAIVSVAVDSTLTTPSEGPAFAVADFNGDSILDVLAGISSNEGQGLGFYAGNGNGTFKPPVSSPANLGTSDFFVGDFNNDGKPDVIVTGYSGFDESSAVFLNNGDGTFTGQRGFAEGDYGGPAAAGDFNGDGNLDLIQVGCTQGYCNLFYLQGNGQGIFPKSHIIDSYDDLGGNVVVGDFNGDGKLDFVEVGSPILLFLGNGDGTFQTPTTISTISGRFVAAADFNGDGKLDLVITESFQGLCVLLGNGDGTFAQNCTGDTQYDSPIFVGDFNGDGKLDLAMTAANGFNSSQIDILFGNGDGTFGNPVVVGTNTSVSAMGDFNGDGRLDFATTGANGVLLSLQSPASLSPLGINYGSHQLGVVSKPQTVTVTNSGTSTIKIASLTFTGNQASDYAATSHCGSGIKPGASCTISVVFTAGGAGGRSGTLNVNYAPGVPTTQYVELTGYGLTTKASFSPSTLAFGFQVIGTTSAPMTSNLENTGVQSLTITGFTVSGPYGYTTNCGSTLAAHASCQVFVTFTPTEVGGYGTLTASTDAGQIALSMTGTGTELLVSPASINFGDQAVGTTSAPSIVTLTNEGHSQSVRLSPISLSGTDRKDFTETTTCGSTLSPGASCTVTVTFTPTARGARSASVQIDGGYGLQAVALSGTGT